MKSTFHIFHFNVDLVYILYIYIFIYFLTLSWLQLFTTVFYDTAHGSSSPWKKMASSFWKGVVGVGLFALAHAAFSAAQRKFQGGQ